MPDDRPTDADLKYEITTVFLRRRGVDGIPVFLEEFCDHFESQPDDRIERLLLELQTEHEVIEESTPNGFTVRSKQEFHDFRDELYEETSW
jgi:hypothetical protein